MSASSSLTTLGFGSVASKGRPVQKIDPGFLFTLGAAIRPLWRVTDLWGLEAASTVKTARDAVTLATHRSIYLPSLRQTRPLGDRLLDTLNLVLARIEMPEWDGSLADEEREAILSALLEFEGAYITEMRNAAIYYIAPHSAFDIEELIENGHKLFPKSLNDKVPEAFRDAKEGAKALAYHLWTASGYHFHRANEAVLRAYFDLVAVGVQRDPKWAMGKLIEKMKEHKVGKKPILAALGNIIEFHRNPLIHPQDFIENADEAVSLYTAIRSAVGYMLDELPDLAPPPLVRMETSPPPIQVVAAPQADA